MELKEENEPFWICHKGGAENLGNGYFIDAADLAKDGIAEWIDHLERKIWFTAECRSNFIVAASFAVRLYEANHGRLAN